MRAGSLTFFLNIAFPEYYFYCILNYHFHDLRTYVYEVGAVHTGRSRYVEEDMEGLELMK